MAKFILLNGFYDAHFIPIEQFNSHGWIAMAQAFNRDPLQFADSEKIGAWLELYDDDNTTGVSTDNPVEIRAALEEVGKWVDELPLSILPRWQEGELLGITGSEDGVLPQVWEDNEDLNESWRR